MSSGRSMQAFCPSAVLVGLGKALGVSLDFLMGGQVEALKGIEFRKHSGTSAQDRAKAEAIVTERLEDYLAIEDILDLTPPTDPFGDLVTDHVESFEAVDGIAYGLRRAWALGMDPVPSMAGLLKDKGDHGHRGGSARALRRARL